MFKFKASEARNVQQKQPGTRSNAPYAERGGYGGRGMPSMRGRGIRGRLVPNPSVVGNLPVNTPPSMDLQSKAMDAPGIMPSMGGRGGFGGVSAYPRGGRGRGSLMGVGMGMDVGGGTGILGIGFAIAGQDEQGVFCDMERYETEMEYRAWYDQFGKMYYKVHG